MGYSAELRTSSRQQQSSKAVKEKAISSRANQNLKFQDKHRVKNTSGQPYTKRYHEIADDVPVVQLKPSGNHQKQLSGTDTKKGDELVKHMSNLPGYLQKIERGENFQEKALNFGVLDWKRLERWKHNEKLVPERGNTKASSPGSSFMGGGSSKLSSTARSKTFASQKKQLSSHSWPLNSAHEERHGVWPQGKVTKPQGFEIAPWNSMAGKQNHDKSSGRKYSEIQLDRGKKKESVQITTSEKETSSSNRRKHGLPISPHDTMSAKDGETNMSVEEELDVAHQSCGQENIVLLLPKSSSRKSFSESSQLSKSNKSFDGNLAEAIGKRLSGCFSPGELHPVELYSEIPHSCPFPVSVASNIEFDMEQCSLVNSQGVELQFDASRNHQRPEQIPTLPSKGKCLEVNSSNIEASTTTETPRRCDQDIAEQPATKGRHPSPSRRLSFSSIGRMTRSFSFKEGSAVPQLNSSYATVKSGPVGSAASADLDKLSRDNACAGSRHRSSPLRRLLDPLLKPRVHSAEPSEVNLNSVSFKPVTTSELLQNQKCETSSIQALLQLTLKNGLPLFKLVVDNSTDILAAAVKKLPTPEEDVSSLIYALYSVHEIKRKSGNWMTKGPKGKSSSLGYNIVGQMKVSSSCLPDSTEQNTKDQYVVRESILYGVEIVHGDKETPKFVPSRELAAIVIKNPTVTNNNGEQIDNGNLCSQDGFMEYLLDKSSDGRENEVSNGTTVILPGGIHGLPNEGLPSPLINRWRSGGSCDCGGWDIGCKLQILTKQGQNSNNLGPLVSCSAVECLDLFVEGGHKEKKPIFSLALFKSGVFSVEFNPSLSLLQAFFISVAFLTGQKLSHLFEVKLEAKSSPEPTGNAIKTPTTIQGNQAQPKYVTNPPPSPVGRV